MSRRPENPGICAFCGAIVTKRGSYKHLDKCQKWQEALGAAAASSRSEETLWLLRVQDAYNKDYWLNLEMVGSASLEKLDYYLRAIWLECCGHLSEFTIGGWGGQQIGKNRKADTVFEPGVVLRHLYDFGTTSETDIKVIGFREGKAIFKNSIALLARNQMPEVTCQECGKKQIGCVSNVSLNVKPLVFFVMHMLKYILMMDMQNQFLWLIRPEWECADMMGQLNHLISLGQWNLYN